MNDTPRSNQIFDDLLETLAAHEKKEIYFSDVANALYLAKCEANEIERELATERATYAEFRKHAWDEQEKLRAELARESARLDLLEETSGEGPDGECYEIEYSVTYNGNSGSARFPATRAEIDKRLKMEGKLK